MDLAHPAAVWIARIGGVQPVVRKALDFAVPDGEHAGVLPTHEHPEAVGIVYLSAARDDVLDQSPPIGVAHVEAKAGRVLRIRPAGPDVADVQVAPFGNDLQSAAVGRPSEVEIDATERGVRALDLDERAADVARGTRRDDDRRRPAGRDHREIVGLD